MSIDVTAIAASVATLAFLFRVSQATLAEERRKQALANAVYHHVEKAIEVLEKFMPDNETTRAKMEDNAAYTPLFINSADDDLTYEHIIGVMEWLDAVGEKAVANYFYDQSTLISISEYFQTEYVRGWDQERRLGLFDIYVEQQQETLKSARGAQAVLKKVRK